MKKLLKMTALAALLAASTSTFAQIKVTPMNNIQTVTVTQEWDKIFPKSDKVDHQKVQFKNRYGITLVGDLYVPKNAKGKLPAIAVSGPFGAVKEQTSGIYAQELAERGFVTLAFDGSFTGESGGEVRNVASPEINTEDFSAAVDFLGLQSFVDREKIGILGICGWGGFALNNAIMDTRVKAVAVSTMYDMTRVMANGYNDSVDKNARYEMRKTLNQARTEAAKEGHIALGNPSDHLPPPSAHNADTPQFVREYADFYKTKRGFHPRSVNSNSAWTTTNALSFITIPILKYADELQTSVLVVHGEKAHSRYFGEDAFGALGSKNKKLVIVPGATHVDLYDKQSGKIPFDKFEAFYKANLK
ncbi:alpha/beta hydrolase [Conservatibacter flavescens]|uniref:Xaa-Pro dipeptidyl-peptidase-like domain-containing protein n=1 Tax=Conservatibacter flavescens TaxID=28161 RepID=A0A2M8S5B9_9PAST|nr:alpha/beta hydrolase [Conservatibacter flavescens]PJG86340.1 hypothetical protein CVP05_00570 [Conservatibacter flavescens]